jgi:hypothetical protein
METGDSFITFKQLLTTSKSSSNRDYDSDYDSDYDNTDFQEIGKIFSSDYCIETPFETGQKISKWLEPGIFCKEVIDKMTKNPYTREKIIGWVPLTTDPNVAMKHMSKIFGHSKELWHFARAYPVVLTQLIKKPWASDYKNALLQTLHLFSFKTPILYSQ